MPLHVVRRTESDELEEAIEHGGTFTDDPSGLGLLFEGHEEGVTVVHVAVLQRHGLLLFHLQFDNTKSGPFRGLSSSLRWSGS